jgi:hypothetical protein
VVIFALAKHSNAELTGICYINIFNFIMQIVLLCLYYIDFAFILEEDQQDLWELEKFCKIAKDHLYLKFSYVHHK